MEKRPYYITTAIAYASATPHIGNVYESHRLRLGHAPHRQRL